MTTRVNNNGLDYTTTEINRNFKIKVYGLVGETKVNKLVGVKGLKSIIGDDKLTNKMIRKAFESTNDKLVCKLRRGVKITFYCY